MYCGGGRGGACGRVKRTGDVLPEHSLSLFPVHVAAVRPNPPVGKGLRGLRAAEAVAPAGRAAPAPQRLRMPQGVNARHVGVEILSGRRPAPW